MTMIVLGCKDRNKSPATAHWDRIVEGQNNELYFIDRNVIERVSDEIVRVPLKYAPDERSISRQPSGTLKRIRD